MKVVLKVKGQGQKSRSGVTKVKSLHGSP